MSNWMKLVVACLAVFGALLVVSFLVHIFHYLVIAAVVLGIGYVILKATGFKALGVNRKSLP